MESNLLLIISTLILLIVSIICLAAGETFMGIVLIAVLWIESILLRIKEGNE
ncbi:hypothetical protein UAY_01818 [Enterococcus moraviensis ATCC BAA-383]|uniref:Uncharacterized protein n=1 Tax=Enterococcus moraviensis ATCC BAA-383 TaxID=1158609 RepID=R2QW07_9ENTE|nr:hypothetical protein [Enterococcus moraviensis]EOI00715.1 hypothetical protein UAY_01818 [Enterococcus moraviensis ATCC BAA-383]EOT73056.1 hypothetical protein I586_00049 [Enterococcus moraviensis ATCC BAA-383]OJG68618.1 hypothetical protein RV09_GL000017 [Enterococcus moraviensis]